MYSNNPSVTVIVPTYNENEILAESIKYLCRQNYPAELIEILLVDDYSTVPAEKFLPCDSPVKIRVVRHGHNKGLAAARNTGILNAVNDLLIFLDSDIFADTNLIASHAQSYNPGDKTAYLGNLEWHPDIKTNNFTKFSRWFEFDKVHDKPKLNFDDFAGGHFSISLKLLMKSNVLFDENFSKYGLEDLEFAYRLINTGFNIKFCRNAIGRHYRQATLSEQINRAKKSAESISYFLRKHKNPFVFQKLKFVQENIYKKYKHLLSDAEKIAEYNAKRFAENTELSPIDQETFHVASTFLIENAPYFSLHNDTGIKLPDNYDPCLKTTVIDWGLRLKILDIIYNHYEAMDIILNEIILPVDDEPLKQSLCHEAGRYLIFEGNYYDASKILSRGLHINVPPNKDLYLILYLLGSICKKQALYNEAEIYFERIINESKNFIHTSQYGSAYFHLGDIISKQHGNPAEIKKCFKLALDYYPSHRAAKEALAEC